MAEYKSRYRRSRLLDATDDLGLDHTTWRPTGKEIDIHLIPGVDPDEGQTIEMVVQKGIPILVLGSIDGCPNGLESLVNQKDFFFEEVSLNNAGKEEENRCSYNLYINGGSRIFFIANPASVTGVLWSMRFFTYEVLDYYEKVVMTWEGDEYGDLWDVCCCCCVCDAHRGIRVKYNKVEIGHFRPVHKRLMPCICSCMGLCFCYIDKYLIEFKLTTDDNDENFQRATTRKSKWKKKRDTGLEVIDSDHNIIARISNCVSSSSKKKKILPIVAETGVKIQFALSMSDAYMNLHPHGKAILLALAIFHESEVMNSQRKVIKDTIGFVQA